MRSASDLWRTTPMRLTLRLVALFALVSMLAFGATWWLANRALLDAAETALESQISEISGSGGPREIAAAVGAAAGPADPRHTILRYDGPEGAVGNYLGPLPDRGLVIVSLEDKPRDVSGDYILLAKDVAGGRLTVGQDADAFEELREVFLKVLGFTLIPTALLVLGGGMLIALRSAQRLRVIEDRLGRLSSGDLTARVGPMAGAPDDLSRVGAGIDRLAVAQEAATAALRQVSADIAHDLKTPIQRLAVLLDQARAQAPDMEVLDRAGEEIDGIVATFHALLRIAQIEGGSPRARFATVDLGVLATTITELFDPAAEDSGHHLTITLDRPASIEGDRTLLAQALSNLIENALRHSPPGPIAVNVRGAAITVADQGPGIPEPEREAVLRRLYRLDRSRTTPGSGLGLALVDAIIKLHGGRLTLSDNAPGLRITADFSLERTTI